MTSIALGMAESLEWKLQGYRPGPTFFGPAVSPDGGGKGIGVVDDEYPHIEIIAACGNSGMTGNDTEAWHGPA